MLSELGANSTEPLTLNTFIQCPASTRPSHFQISESRPYCCCAPRTGAASTTARAAKSLVLFIVSPWGGVRTVVDYYAAAEGLRGNFRPAVTDRKLDSTFLSQAFPGPNRDGKVRLQIAAESLHAELRPSTARNVQPQRSRVGLEAVSARGLARSRVDDVTAHRLCADTFRLDSHEADVAAYGARLDVASHVLYAKVSAHG